MFRATDWGAGDVIGETQGSHKMLCTDGYGRLGSTIRIPGVARVVAGQRAAARGVGNVLTDGWDGRFTDGAGVVWPSCKPLELRQ
ncbi:hypothetical protein [Croceicoccus gelatinilyticus]|uniref:hypothetical protein n=1 Tax=Croceicoccus gelatinilyticus TaxID=2835536 RepID=UPI001BD18EF3|nr:hypothetical protein [Croceicoccus gelatinilyticus]MBS7669349.1 hypothetical protein [Croceicoccus gelatinilyticus]